MNKLLKTLIKPPLIGALILLGIAILIVNAIEWLLYQVQTLYGRGRDFLLYPEPEPGKVYEC